MRTLSQIIDSIRIELGAENSALARFSKFSNLYMLFRTVAKAILEVEAYVESESETKYLSSLTGPDLDLKAAEYGITRDSVGVPAVGSVLLSSQFTTAVPVNTVFTDTDSNNQFTLISSEIVDTNEKAVFVKSVEPQFVALPAGTSLYSSLYPNVTAVVGSYRDVVTDLPQTDLVGGSAVEDDEALRLRVLARINSSYISTEQGVISSILEQVSVSRVYIQNNYPITGYMSVFVDSDDELIKREVESVLDTVVAAGTNYYVYPIKRVAFDINVNVTMSVSSNVRAIDSEIRNRLSQYISTLHLGENVRRSTLLGLLFSVPGVVDGDFTYPEQDIQLNDNELPVINNVYITVTNV